MDANKSAPAKSTLHLQLWALLALALLIAGVIFFTPTTRRPTDRQGDLSDAKQEIDRSIASLREAQQTAQTEALAAARQDLIDAGVLPPNDPLLRPAPLPVADLTLAGALVALVLTAGLYPVLTAISRNYPDGRQFARAFSALACIATALHLATHVYSLTIGRQILSPAIQLFALGIEIPGLLLAITTLVRPPAPRPALHDSPEALLVPADL